MLLTMVASHSKQAAAILHAPANFRITLHSMNQTSVRNRKSKWEDQIQEQVHIQSITKPSALEHSAFFFFFFLRICDQQGEESDLEDEKVLNEKWLKSEAALNVAKLELIQLKKKNLELETQAKVELMQLEKKELVLRIKTLEQDTADK